MCANKPCLQRSWVFFGSSSLYACSFFCYCLVLIISLSISSQLSFILNVAQQKESVVKCFCVYRFSVNCPLVPRNLQEGGMTVLKASQLCQLQNSGLSFCEEDL